MVLLDSGGLREGLKFSERLFLAMGIGRLGEDPGEEEILPESSGSTSSEMVLW